MEVYLEDLPEGTLAKVVGSVDALHVDVLKTTRCLGDPSRDVILDFSGVDFLDSTGLGAIILMHRDFERADHRLVMTGARPIVLRTLQMTGVDRVIPICDSLVEAIERLADPA